jgi:SpoVK/Ycf46/Vps4 family AAA+-type ATPase
MMFIRDLVRLAFDHHDRFFSTGHDEVQVRFATLVVRRIDKIFTLDQADANARDRIFKRYIRKIKSTRGTGYRDYIRIVLRVDETTDATICVSNL